MMMGNRLYTSVSGAFRSVVQGVAVLPAFQLLSPPTEETRSRDSSVGIELSLTAGCKNYCSIPGRGNRLSSATS
jgi:hypothetical protein